MAGSTAAGGAAGAFVGGAAGAVTGNIGKGAGIGGAAGAAGGLVREYQNHRSQARSIKILCLVVSGKKATNL